MFDQVRYITLILFLHMHFFAHFWDELGSTTGGETTALPGKPKAAAVKLPDIGISQKTHQCRASHKHTAPVHTCDSWRPCPNPAVGLVQALLSKFVSRTAKPRASWAATLVPDSLLQPLCLSLAMQAPAAAMLAASKGVPALQPECQQTGQEAREMMTLWEK